MSRDRRYVCVECGKPVTDLEAVRKRFAWQRKCDIILFDLPLCPQCAWWAQFGASVEEKRLIGWPQDLS